MSIELKLKNLARPKESKIEKDLVRIVLDNNGACLKFTSPGSSGMPDRICLFPNGKVWFVELKKPGKKADPLQDHVRAFLRKYGFKVSVISNQEQLKQFENEISGA